MPIRWIKPQTIRLIATGIFNRRWQALQTMPHKFAIVWGLVSDKKLLGTLMKFSSRFSATNNKERAIILEDAPRPTRIGFIKGILGDFVGESSGYHPRKEPLDAYETHKAFIALIRDEADPWDYDNESRWSALTSHLKICSWLEFYDFVELVGSLLKEVEAEEFFTITNYFKNYQSMVNSLLQEDNIGWGLNEKSELIRQIPSSLAEKIKVTESELTDRFSTARVHYQKAYTYLYKYPIDEANSIKEIVSAIESVSKVFFPSASTLGEAIKFMKKDTRFSKHLVEALEKLYVFSNATPLIRHGHSENVQPLLSEAELAKPNVYRATNCFYQLIS